MHFIKKSILSFTAVASVSALNAQDYPNIVVFLVDDMGLMDTSVPFAVDNNGNPAQYPLNDWYQTPHMEKLASQGIRFSTFYAQSVSSPTRASLLTGQNATRHRTTNWINSESNNRTPYRPLKWNWEGLTSSVKTYPSLLKKAGYKTIHVGKAHFGSNNTEGEDPTQLGFDVNIAGSSIGQPGSYYGVHGYGSIKGQIHRAVPDLEEYHGTDTFLTDALTLEANKAIEETVKADKPFFLNMSHYAVHAPFEPDSRFIENYPEGQKNNQARAFATLIEGMDKSLGDIMIKLEELDVAENTLILFLGDNGGDAPLGGPSDYGSSAPFKGKKGSEYEGGSRVPFIACWAKPASQNKFQKNYPIAQNKIQTQMGTIMDIYPTVLSAAGIALPEDHILDGKDLKKLLKGQKDEKHPDYFLLHFPHEHRGSYFTTYRKGDWKLIYYYNPQKDGVPSHKLYNLKTDPFEKEDVSTSNPKKLAALCELMIEQLDKDDALYPVDEDMQTIYPVIP